MIKTQGSLSKAVSKVIKSGKSSNLSKATNKIRKIKNPSPRTPVVRRGTSSKNWNFLVEFDSSIIGEIKFTSHAVNRMNQRGLVPSVIEEALSYGKKSLGNRPGSFEYFDSVNNVKVVLNIKGDVITLY